MTKEREARFKLKYDRFLESWYGSSPSTDMPRSQVEKLVEEMIDAEITSLMIRLMDADEMREEILKVAKEYNLI